MLGICQVGTSFGDAALGEYIAKLWGERGAGAPDKGASFIAVKSFNDELVPITGVVNNTARVYSNTATILKLSQEVFGAVMASIMKIRKKKNMQVALYAIRHKASLGRLKYVDETLLTRYMQVVRFPPDSVLCREGKPIKYIHILVQGKCSLRAHGDKCLSLQPGDVFGMFPM